MLYEVQYRTVPHSKVPSLALALVIPGVGFFGREPFLRVSEKCLGIGYYCSFRSAKFLRSFLQDPLSSRGTRPLAGVFVRSGVGEYVCQLFLQSYYKVFRADVVH